MIIVDLSYRKLLRSQLFHIVKNNHLSFQQTTVSEITKWTNAFVLCADESIWDVNVELLYIGAIELLQKFYIQFKILWEKACSDLGNLMFFHKIVNWSEHKEVNTIIGDIELFLENQNVIKQVSN